MAQNNLHSVNLRHKDLHHHLVYLLTPLLIFVSLIIWTLGIAHTPWGLLVIAVLIYLLCWTLDYIVCHRKLREMCQHLEQVVQVNNTTYDLMDLSSNYETEAEFLAALLRRAVDLVPGAEMGCVLILDQDTQKLQFQTVVGMDLPMLQALELKLSNSFAHRATNGKCDQVVIINDMRSVNADSSLTQQQQDALMGAAHRPIMSTMSSPIYINGKLYAMMNLDSHRLNAFGSYDLSLAGILTHEACNAISLYHKSRQIAEMASRDSLTGLYNRPRFEDLVAKLNIDGKTQYQLLVIDMNNLKNLNDDHGHQAGDKALIKLAKALNEQWGSCFPIARFGGDEFVVMYQGNSAQIRNDLKQIRDHLAAQPGHKVQFSAGWAPYINNWESAFKAADRAMYDQKRLSKLCQLEQP